MILDFSNAKIYKNAKIAELHFVIHETTEIFYLYIDKNKKIIADIKIELDAQFKKLSMKVTDEYEYGSIYSEYSDILYKEHEKFKEINYKTMVVQIFTFLESIMRELYYLLYNNEKETIEVIKKLNVNQLFIKNIYPSYGESFHLVFDEITEANYTKIAEYNDVRNAIAHNWKCDWENKPLLPKYLNLEKLIESEDLLEKDFYNDSFKIKNEQFLLNFINLVNKFSVQLFDIIDEKLNKTGLTPQQ